jgi:glutathione peroxidase
MTYRQRLLKKLYPTLMKVTNTFGIKSKKMDNTHENKPVSSLNGLEVTLNNGSTLDLGTLKGKKILLVNTASNCGYTSQYEDLQKLYDEHRDKLVIIAFPANDFKEQEKGDDAQIAEFCRVNFGISFPLAKKSTVVKGENQNPVFKWLSNKAENGWNDQEPTWNFSKYLVDENGTLTNYFDPGISPLSKEIKSAISE